MTDKTLTGKVISINAADAADAAAKMNLRVIIELLDVSLADAPSKTLAKQTVVIGPNAPRLFPIPFKLAYSSNKIQKRNRYCVSVRIEDMQSKLYWITTTQHSVLTNGAPADQVTVRVERV
ncbi:hypothetical protein BGW38_004200 [Lunasporangiospora selenospora]|uniref:Lipoprotein n=1 Tax=Lunasporangiospora selenospora TaxID=979761 RepID=A0A9P6FPL1_9FUNG|nr:hypothetical protein BGW38_004200 [Lunasporangiospora selenospora]